MLLVSHRQVLVTNFVPEWILVARQAKSANRAVVPYTSRLNQKIAASPAKVPQASKRKGIGLLVKKIWLIAVAGVNTIF